MVFNPPIRCPAGTPLYETAEGSGCRCGIERNSITALRDPSSLLNFCMGDFHMCPSWEFEQNRIEDGHRLDVIEHDPDRRAAEAQVDGWKEKLVEMNKRVEVTHFEVPE
jgi:hypothetical protein